MGLQSSFHAPVGDGFLGWRISRSGKTQIVFESGAEGRIVWQVASAIESESGLVEALSLAVASSRIVPSLYDELKKRAIAIERLEK